MTCSRKKILFGFYYQIIEFTNSYIGNGSLVRNLRYIIEEHNYKNLFRMTYRQRNNC